MPPTGISLPLKNSSGVGGAHISICEVSSESSCKKLKTEDQ